MAAQIGHRLRVPKRGEGNSRQLTAGLCEALQAQSRPPARCLSGAEDTLADKALRDDAGQKLGTLELKLAGLYNSSGRLLSPQKFACCSISVHSRNSGSCSLGRPCVRIVHVQAASCRPRRRPLLVPRQAWGHFVSVQGPARSCQLVTSRDVKQQAGAHTCADDRDPATHWDSPRHLAEQSMKSSHLVGVMKRRHALRQTDC